MLSAFSGVILSRTLGTRPGGLGLWSSLPSAFEFYESSNELAEFCISIIGFGAAMYSPLGDLSAERRKGIGSLGDGYGLPKLSGSLSWLSLKGSLPRKKKKGKKQEKKRKKTKKGKKRRKKRTGIHWASGSQTSDRPGLATRQNTNRPREIPFARNELPWLRQKLVKASEQKYHPGIFRVRGSHL